MKRMIVYIWIIKGVVFLLFLLSIVYLLGSKYIEEGECVAILYYLPIIAILCIYGNNILASVEVNWPHTYHPKPYFE